MKSKHQANHSMQALVQSETEFLADVQKVFTRACNKSARENKLTRLSANPQYWKAEQQKAKQGLTHAILAPWIKV
jgi:hypothetical protein